MSIDEFEDSIIRSYRGSDRSEKWIIRGVGFFLSACIGLTANFVYDMSQQIQGLRIEMAAISKELTLVKPADVLMAVQTLERKQLSENDVRSIINQQKTPWDRDRAEWQSWRRDIEQRLRELELMKRRK